MTNRRNLQISIAGAFLHLSVETSYSHIGNDVLSERFRGDYENAGSLTFVRRHRHLQDRQMGETVLTAIYLCVVGLCFGVPIFYFFRMRWEDREVRRLRELELAGITHALAQSQNVHREESRAARRKFRDERKARICQLFQPVKMTLSTDAFPHLRVKQGAKTESDSDKDITSDTPPTEIPSPNETIDDTSKSIDLDQLNIEVPSPGFHIASASVVVGQMTKREVQNVCTICLCNYAVGDKVVWSSNEACEHVFHEQCILQWLMKQRDGPLCPCCRRDFVIDPFDSDEGDLTAVFSNQLLEDEIPGQASHDDSSLDEQEEVEEDQIDSATAANIAAAQVEAMAMLEEGVLRRTSFSSHSSGGRLNNDIVDTDNIETNDNDMSSDRESAVHLHAENDTERISGEERVS